MNNNLEEKIISIILLIGFAGSILLIYILEAIYKLQKRISKLEEPKIKDDSDYWKGTEDEHE